MFMRPKIPGNRYHYLADFSQIRNFTISNRMESNTTFKASFKKIISKKRKERGF